MPQEFHVLCCYNCSFFQVQIVKKNPKWECKVCGEKQSVKKVFAKGSGKDCRLVVQQLNASNITRNDQVSNITDDGSTSNQNSDQVFPSNQTTSKWSEFLTSSHTNSEENSSSNIIKNDEANQNNAEVSETVLEQTPYSHEKQTSKWKKILSSSTADSNKSCKRKHQDSDEQDKIQCRVNKKKETGSDRFESDDYDLDSLINL